MARLGDFKIDYTGSKYIHERYGLYRRVSFLGFHFWQQLCSSSDVAELRVIKDRMSRLPKYFDRLGQELP